MAQPFVPIHQISAKQPIADFVETRLLNLTGGPTMVGTKALRMTLANPDIPWIEMAARRASSYDTGMMIAKYSYIGGAGKCVGTSLTSAGKKYGIPLKGTSSHSSVLAFETQLEAFRSYADIFKEKSAFILDTYGYVRGTQDAIQVAKEMGLKNFSGRLDTDDLAFQSKVVRELLDGNGFNNAKIIVSNDIDENIRKSLKEQNAKNDSDGIGTSLNPPPLGIVYKPVVINGRQVMKLSCPQKITDPCSKDIYRLFDDKGQCKAYVATKYGEDPYIGIYHHRNKDYEKKKFSDLSTIEKILIPVLKDDQRLIKCQTIQELQQKVAFEANKMWPEIKRFENPSEFPLYLSDQLWNTKQMLKQKFQIIKEG
jgi:nicotinate phosphoribosyltransferase